MGIICSTWGGGLTPDEDAGIASDLLLHRDRPNQSRRGAVRKPSEGTRTPAGDSCGLIAPHKPKTLLTTACFVERSFTPLFVGNSMYAVLSSSVMISR